MIINFSVKNFRSIKDTVTLSFEPENSNDLEDYYIMEPIPGLRLLKMGLIYGANGSGKTTILKALNFLRLLAIRPLSKKTDNIEFSPFLFDDSSSSENSKFELSFVQNDFRYLYEIELTRSFIVRESLYSYSPNKSLVYERNTDEIKQLTSIEFGGKFKVNKLHKATLEANTLWNTTVLSGFLKTNIDSIELKNVTDWFNQVLKGMITPTTNLRSYITDRLESNEIDKDHLVLFLNKADFKIKDISIEKKQEPVNDMFLEIMKVFNKQERVTDDSFKQIEASGKIEGTEIVFEHSVIENNKEFRYRLPYIEESQGTQRYYQFSGLLDLMIRNKVIFPIDELESSLHPDLLKHFLLIFLVNSKRSQLIATTHHRELLMDRDILRDDVIWFTEKKIDGSMELYALSDFDSSIVRDTTSIFNAYRSGKLGAIPELSDYYLDSEDGKK